MKTNKEVVFFRPALTPRIVLLGLALITSVQAQLTITLPTISDLRPNTPGQTFQVFVSNPGSAQAVNGLDFNIQVADGGTAAPGGSINGPAITGADILTGTIFQSNNNGLHGIGQIVPQVFEVSTLTLSGTVDIPANSSSLIATVTVDTSGFSSGSWTMTLDTKNNITWFTTTGAEIRPTLVNGMLSIVPEPEAYAALAASACVLVAIACRCRKSVLSRGTVGC